MTIHLLKKGTKDNNMDNMDDAIYPQQQAVKEGGAMIPQDLYATLPRAFQIGWDALSGPQQQQILMASHRIRVNNEEGEEEEDNDAGGDDAQEHRQEERIVLVNDTDNDNDHDDDAAAAAAADPNNNDAAAAAEVANEDDAVPLPQQQQPDDDDDDGDDDAAAAADPDNNNAVAAAAEVANEDDAAPRPPPLPEDLELEYTYPQDFIGRRWQDVIRRDAVTGRYHYFRLLIDPSCDEIPDEIFQNCDALVELVFPDGKSKLDRIGWSAFSHCKSLRRMNKLPAGLTKLDGFAFFHCERIEGELIIPSSIERVDMFCFGHCYSITSVVFEPSSSNLPLRHGSFRHCTGITTVALPQSLSIIPSHCFDGCTALVDIPIPGTVQIIQMKAFYHCSSLQSVDLPENVTHFEKEAYAECTALSSVTIRASSRFIRTYHFADNIFGSCPALFTILIHPWYWPRLFAAMRNDPSFIFKFLRDYHYQMDRYIQWNEHQRTNSIITVPSSAVMTVTATAMPTTAQISIEISGPLENNSISSNRDDDNDTDEPQTTGTTSSENNFDERSTIKQHQEFEPWYESGCIPVVEVIIIVLYLICAILRF